MKENCVNNPKCQVMPMTKEEEDCDSITDSDVETVTWRKGRILQFVTWYLVPVFYIFFTIIYFTYYAYEK